MLGRSETEVTQRNAHLRPDLFPAEDRQVLAIDLDAYVGPNCYNSHYESESALRLRC